MWRRLTNLIRGFFGLFISGLERQNPEALLEVETENLRKQIRRRCDGGDAPGQGRQAALPRLDSLAQRGVRAAALLHRLALGRIERSEHVLGRQSVNVVRFGHRPRQSFSCARLRRSHVFTVAAGRPIRVAISSRVRP